MLGFLALAAAAASSPRPQKPEFTSHAETWFKPLKPHRPKPQPLLPHRLEVDENDQGDFPQPFSLRPSHNPVGTGVVQFNVYNFGQDPHTFAVVDASGRQRAFVNVPAMQPDTAAPVSVNLRPGRYTLVCTLQGHAALGMIASLTVR
jgi:hypothetical protein